MDHRFKEFTLKLICKGIVVQPDHHPNYKFTSQFSHFPIMITVEPPNKGHYGYNINSAVVSFAERLSSFGGSKCIRTIGKTIFGLSAHHRL